jgi:retron-type reverse transcriptase
VQFEVTVATIRDRVVQTAAMLVLEPSSKPICNRNNMRTALA